MIPVEIANVLINVISYSLVYVFTTVIYWKLFKKMDETNWKALIPLYRLAVLYKKLNISIVYLIVPVVSLILTIIAYAYGFANGWYFDMLSFPIGYAIIMLVFMLTFIISWIVGVIKKAFSLSEAFNKSIVFAIGLMLLENIFLLIIAFSKDKFDGSKVIKQKNKI